MIVCPSNSLCERGGMLLDRRKMHQAFTWTILQSRVHWHGRRSLSAALSIHWILSRGVVEGRVIRAVSLKIFQVEKLNPNDFSPSNIIQYVIKFKRLAKITKWPHDIIVNVKSPEKFNFLHSKWYWSQDYHSSVDFLSKGCVLLYVFSWWPFYNWQLSF